MLDRVIKVVQLEGGHHHPGWCLDQLVNFGWPGLEVGEGFVWVEEYCCCPDCHLGQVTGVLDLVDCYPCWIDCHPGCHSHLIAHNLDQVMRVWD